MNTQHCGKHAKHSSGLKERDHGWAWVLGCMMDVAFLWTKNYKTSKITHITT